MTYEERVSALAEAMYRGCMGIKKDKPISALDWAIAGDGYITAARIVVSEMAIAYEKGRAKGYELGTEWYEGKPITITPKFELIEQGLIPDTEQYKTAPAGQQETK